MTSTSVKDVGSVLNTLGAASGNGVRPADSGGFRSVFDGRTGRNTAEGQPDGTRTKVRKVPGDSLKAKDDHLTRVSEEKPAKMAEDPEDTVELPEEKLTQIMEVLGTAAADMMQQIADTLGVSAEELQSAMEELGMSGPDLLDVEQLGALLLKVKGEEDPYALLTNGELYDSYQELTGKLEELLRETGEELQLDPEQMEEAIRQAGGQETEAVFAETPELSVETEETAAPWQDSEQAVQEPEEPEGEEAVWRPEDRTQAQKEAGEDTAARQGEDHENHSERREDNHLFTQAFRTENFQEQFRPELRQTYGAAENRSAETQDIMRQIMDYMRVQVKADTSSLEMQLHPESLGTLHIQVASKGGVLTANFITQNEAVKAALESQMVQLKENFEQQGVKVEAIEVTVEAHAFERNLDQGRGQDNAQEQPGRRTRTRRITLDDSFNMEDLEAEDTLAAEIMAANGNQVDYTA